MHVTVRMVQDVGKRTPQCGTDSRSNGTSSTFPSYVVAAFVYDTYLVICRGGRVFEVSLTDPLSPLVSHFDAWDVRFEGNLVRVYLHKNFYVASRLENATCEAYRRVSNLVRSAKLV